MTSTLTQQDTTAQQDRRQVEILGMIGTRDASESRPGSGPAIDPVYTRALRPRPRGGRLRPHPHRVRLELARGHPGRRPRGRAHRAARPARGPPTGLRRADPGVARLRHPRPVLRGPGGGAHHHRRPRRRAAPRRRLPRPRRALRPHRRVPHHPPARVDLVRALRLRGPALPLRGLRARRAAVRRPPPAAVLRRLVGGGVPGRRQARGHVHAVGRAARRDRRADRVGAGRRRGRRPAGAADQRVVPPDHRADRGARLGAGARDPRPDQERAGAVVPAGAQACPRTGAAERGLAAAAPRRREGRPARPRAVDARPRRPPAPAATRPRSSAAPRRWPPRSSTTSRSASTPC